MRKRLAKKYTEKCGRDGCHHGKASHVRGGKCRMKHCKCGSFK